MAAYLGNFDVDADLRSTRAICHVDLDAFYAQVEEHNHPHLRGMSIAVIQYNPFGDLKTYRETDDRVFNDSNGSIIALSYGEARKRGVKRNMRGGEARQLCPNLQLVQVPTSNGKADLTSYRRDGAAVLAILSEPDGDVGTCCELATPAGRIAIALRLGRRGAEIVCEKASIDESYLDVTDAAKQRLKSQKQSWAHALPDYLEQVHVGCQIVDPLLETAEQQTAADWYSRPSTAWTATDALLAHASQIVAEKRAKVHAVLGFTLSAGVAHSKLLAKLCSGLNKPNQQTVLPASSVPDLLHDLPLSKLRGLGGQLGDKVQSELGVHKIGELSQVPVSRLHSIFGDDTGTWLYHMCRGIDRDVVQPRLAPKSVGCGKSFTAHLQIKKLETVHYWLQNLAQEIHDRLEEDATEHGRKATRLVLHVASEGGHSSRGSPLPSHGADVIARIACQLINERAKRDCRLFPITGLSLVASSFDSSAANTGNLRTMFAACQRAEEPVPTKFGVTASSDVVDKVAAGSIVPDDACCPADPVSCWPACEGAARQKVSTAPPPTALATAMRDSMNDGTDQPGEHAPQSAMSMACYSGQTPRPHPGRAAELNSSDAVLCSDTLHTHEPKSYDAPPNSDSIVLGPDSPRPGAGLSTNAVADADTVEVDAFTLAQMPSDIRSELYLMSAHSKHGRHQPRSAGTQQGGVKNKIRAKRPTSGITAFFGAKRSKDS